MIKREKKPIEPNRFQAIHQLSDIYIGFLANHGPSNTDRHRATFRWSIVYSYWLRLFFLAEGNFWINIFNWISNLPNKFHILTTR